MNGYYRRPLESEQFYKNLTIERKLGMLHYFVLYNKHTGTTIHNNDLINKIDLSIRRYLGNHEDLDANYDIACACICMIGCGIIESTYGYKWCEEFLEIGINQSIPKFLHQKALLIYHHDYMGYTCKYGWIDVHGEPRELIDKACELSYMPSILFRLDHYEMTHEERQKLFIRNY